MQPHFPYLPLGESEGFSGVMLHVSRRGGDEKKPFHKIRELVGKLLVNFLGKLKVNKLRGTLGIGPSEPIREVAKNYGEKRLHELYEKNLRIAIEEAGNLAKVLPGKIIVTSDHGEFLGENGFYSHADGYDSPILKEVPWLEVERKNTND